MIARKVIEYAQIDDPVDYHSCCLPDEFSPNSCTKQGDPARAKSPCLTNLTTTTITPKQYTPVVGVCKWDGLRSAQIIKHQCVLRVENVRATQMTLEPCSENRHHYASVIRCNPWENRIMGGQNHG